MNAPAPSPTNRPSSWKRTALIVCCILLGAATLAVASTAWLVKRNVFASPFKPVALTAAESAVLTDKVAALKQAAEAPAQAPVDPEVAKRTLTLSEKEINAFLQQQGAGEQVKVALRDGGATATFLIPVGEGAEVGKGMTLRISASIDARMDDTRKFKLAITDVSVAGVPLPNAWLGGVKGLNLFNDQTLTDEPAVKAFVAGIRDFKLESGLLRIVLNE